MEYRFYRDMTHFISQHINSFDIEFGEYATIYAARNFDFSLLIPNPPHTDSLIEYKKNKIWELKPKVDFINMNGVISNAYHDNLAAVEGELLEEQQEQLEIILREHRPQLFK